MLNAQKNFVSYETLELLDVFLFAVRKNGNNTIDFNSALPDWY